MDGVLIFLIIADILLLGCIIVYAVLMAKRRAVVDEAQPADETKQNEQIPEPQAEQSEEEQPEEDYLDEEDDDEDEESEEDDWAANPDGVDEEPEPGDEIAAASTANAAAFAPEPIMPYTTGKRKPAVPFFTKMLESEESLQNYYNDVRNEFKMYKGVNARISKKCDSFRFGRQLIAKITLSGKSMRFYLRLNVADFNENKYHQKFVGDKKSYVEIPMMVKIRSERSYKNAIALVDALAEQMGAERKKRFTKINYLETLKALEHNQ